MLCVLQFVLTSFVYMHARKPFSVYSFSRRKKTLKENEGKEVRFNRIINGLSLTKLSLNDWLCISKKSPCHSETLIQVVHCREKRQDSPTFSIFPFIYWSKSIQKEEKGDSKSNDSLIWNKNKNKSHKLLNDMLYTRGLCCILEDYTRGLNVSLAWGWLSTFPDQKQFSFASKPTLCWNILGEKNSKGSHTITPKNNHRSVLLPM